MVVGAWGQEEVLAMGCTAGAGELAKGDTAGEAAVLGMR